MSTNNIQVVLHGGLTDEEAGMALARRGISASAAASHWVGFVHDTIFGGTRRVWRSFCIPMFGVGGELLGLKMHRDFVSEGEGKCYWLFPADDCKALWPPPEWSGHASLPDSILDWPARWVDRFEELRASGSPFVPESFRDELAEWQARKAFGAASSLREPDGQWLFLCGGELKALAMIGAGLWATAPMVGESNFWTPRLIGRLSGLRVCIVYDDDKQGRRFRDATISALMGHAAEIKAITFGVKPDGKKMDANDVAAAIGAKGLAADAARLLGLAERVEADQWRRENPMSEHVRGGVLPADLLELDRLYEAEDYKGVSRAERMERYAAYLGAYPEAVSGDSGHATLLKAVAHRHGFGVPASDAIKALRDYNARCAPPWSDGELLHKLEDARPLSAFMPGSRMEDELSEEEMMEIVFTPGGA